MNSWEMHTVLRKWERKKPVGTHAAERGQKMIHKHAHTSSKGSVGAKRIASTGGKKKHNPIKVEKYGLLSEPA